jgi:phosphoribosylformylglycinamidine synthase
VSRELDISIPVGKDSLSMQTVWKDGGTQQRTVSPVSLVITGFCPRQRRAPHA